MSVTFEHLKRLGDVLFHPPAEASPCSIEGVWFSFVPLEFVAKAVEARVKVVKEF